MRRLAAILLLVLIPALAQAQQIIQSGKPIPGRAGKWITNLTQGDAGPANGGPPGTGLTELNNTSTLNNDQPFCINDAPITNTGGYHQLCMGAGGVFSYNAYGGASPLPLQFNINGATYNFPGPGNGNVVGPTPTTINELASFNNTTGSLLRQGPATLTGAWYAPATGDSAALGVTSDPAYTAAQILQWAFTIGTPASSYDAVRGIAHGVAGSALNLVNGISGYVVNDMVASPGFPSANAINGIGISAVDGAHTWGINTILTDAKNATGPTTGANRSLNNEFDFNVTSPSTHVGGLQLGGSSLVQPALANGFIVFPLSEGDFGATAHWNGAFVSTDGSANFGLSLGTVKPPSITPNGSQPIAFVWLDNTGTRHFTSLYADGLTNLALRDSGAAPLDFVLYNGAFYTPGNTSTSSGGLYINQAAAVTGDGGNNMQLCEGGISCSIKTNTVELPQINTTPANGNQKPLCVDMTSKQLFLPTGAGTC